MAKFGEDAKVTKRIPKKQMRDSLPMPMKGKDFKGRFNPRTEQGGGAPKSMTKNPVLPKIQPRKKSVLGGVYED